MGDRSVIITWEYDSAFIYQMEYATRWSNDWTNRPLVEAQVITGQESFDGLVAGETYKFHMRAIGKVEEGQNYYSTTEWSEYSHPILVTLGPPPAPDSLGVSSKTETSVILSYGPVSGATYQVQYRKTTPDDSGSWQLYDSDETVTGSLFQVEGLDSGTEYDFQVRAVGDGSKYKAAASPWSETLVVRTNGYAALVPAPPLLRQCKAHHTSPRVTDTDDHTFANGATHNARLEIWGNAVTNPLREGYPNYCVQGRFVSEVTPGVDTAQWSGSIKHTVSSITWEEAFNWQNINPGAFYALYDSDPPEAGARPVRIAIHDCTSPCRGGTIQTTAYFIPRKYIKTASAYVNGFHTATVNGVSHTLTTDGSVDATPAGHSNIVLYWVNVGLEIAEDLAPQPVQPIVDWLQQAAS